SVDSQSGVTLFPFRDMLDLDGVHARQFLPSPCPSRYRSSRSLEILREYRARNGNGYCCNQKHFHVLVSPDTLHGGICRGGSLAGEAQEGVIASAKSSGRGNLAIAIGNFENSRATRLLFAPG